MALPTDGETDWGDILNAQLESDEAAAAVVSASLSAHEGNSPADPHGDRAYANTLVQPLTTGTNEPDGYVVLNSDGQIPLDLLPSAGGTNNWYDVRNSEFGATGSGTVDDSTAINLALSTAASAGGGVVWIPNGTYGIGSPLVIGNGTTLFLSAGAVIQRISPVAAPQVMLQNYSTGNAASTGKFTVMGGTWDAVGTTNQNTTNVIFSFVNATQVILENMVLNQVSNGASPYGAFYGCSNVTVYNVTLEGASPSKSRAYCLNPCFRVEQTNSTNITGLVYSDYASQMCNGVDIISTSLVCGTETDSNGLYSPWHSMCGTIGTISSGSLFHTNILVNVCNATAFAVTGIYGYNWNQVTFTLNSFNNPGNGIPFIQDWVSSAPSNIQWIVTNNEQPSNLVATGSLTTTSSSPEASASVQVISGFTYLVRAWAIFNGSNTAKNATYGLFGPGTGELSSTVQAPSGGGVTGGGEGYNQTLTSPDYTSSGHYSIVIQGYLNVTATGIVSLEFATTGGTLSVPGSSLELIPVFS